MSSRVIACLMMSFCAAAAACQVNWESLAAGSDRSLDTFLIQALDEDDLETALQICHGIGKRSDPSAAAYLGFLASSHRAGASTRAELLLRVLLASLLDPAQGTPKTDIRIQANAAALEDLLRMVTSFEPPLASALVRLAPRVSGEARLHALMSVGTRLISALESSRGEVSPPLVALGLDYVASVRLLRDRAFLEPCAAIARLARDESLASAGRQAALELLAPPPSP